MDGLAIVDLGGQYCHLIARRLRDLGVESTICGPDVVASNIVGARGVILSGGPRSVYETGAPRIDERILSMGVPVLGICYGHQLLAQMLGGSVEQACGEYGLAQLRVQANEPLFAGTCPSQPVWMSHGDAVMRLPEGMVILARTDRTRVAAFADLRRQYFGVQFHPEVVHTKWGGTILSNFALRVCGVVPSEDLHARVARLIDETRERIGERKVFFLVSGGVDSTVAFALCARAVSADKIVGLYVDTGFMRRGETAELRKNLRLVGLDKQLRIRDESRRFTEALRTVNEPEEKRRVIGRLFVEVQSEAMREYHIGESDWLLGQGTIYPDTIESGGARGQASVIKTHHNRCDEIRTLMARGLVIEPLVDFYKDEVRRIGAELGLDRKLTDRWPFPGPGLAIRCLCKTVDEAVSAVDAAVAGYLSDYNYEGTVLPISSVGVQGDARTYRHAIALATSEGSFDYDRLSEISTALCNSDPNTNRVVQMIGVPQRELSTGVVRRAGMDPARIECLREADFVVRSILEESGLSDSVWQFPVVLLPLSFRGGETVCLRPVTSEDGMTATFGRLEPSVILRMAEEIRRIRGIDAVCLDVTSKPPATIEWE